jgi:hypothetical protein
MGLKEYLLKFTDFIGGIFLVLAGLFLIYLYACLHSKTNNWFTALSVLLFLLGLGIGAIIVGVRRLFLSSRKKTA